MYSFKHLTRFFIHAQDGDMGHIHDLYYNKKNKIRYIAVDTGNWLPGKKVLVSPSAVENIYETDKKIYVAHTKEYIQDCPEIGTQELSYDEEEYDDHAGLIYYWTGHEHEDERKEVVDPESELHKYRPEHHFDQGQGSTQGGHTPPPLRSVREAMNFRIHEVDGRLGHVEDFLISKETWTLTYMVVRTKKWLPGKKVLLAPDHITDIRWLEKEVYVDITEKEVLEAPDYDPESPPDEKQ